MSAGHADDPYARPPGHARPVPGQTGARAGERNGPRPSLRPGLPSFDVASTERAGLGAGLVWTTTAFVLGRAVTFASLLVVTRAVSPEEFGVVAAILAFLGVLELVGGAGMRSTVVFEQETGVTPRVDVAFTINLLLAAACAAVGVLAAPLVAGFFGVEEATWLFRLAAANIVLTALGTIHDGLLVRDLAFRRRAVPLLVRGVVRGVATIALALAGLGATALVLGLLAGTAAWTALMWAMADEHPRLRLDRAIARSTLRYGSGAATLELIALVGSRLDVVVIGRVLGTGPLGVYTLALRLPELVIASMAWNVSAVAFPLLSARRGRGADDTTLALLRWQALYGLPAAAGLAVLAEPLVLVLFGPAWGAAAGVLVAIAAAEAIAVAIFPIGDALRAAGHQHGWIGLQLLVLPLLVVLVVLVAPSGLVAVAWVRVAELVVFAAGALALAGRHLGLQPAAVLAAFGPGVVAASGVLLAAGAVRLAWPAIGVAPLTAGVAAGVAGALLALRLAAPETWSQVRVVLARGARARPSPG